MKRLFIGMQVVVRAGAHKGAQGPILKIFSRDGAQYRVQVQGIGERTIIRKSRSGEGPYSKKIFTLIHASNVLPVSDKAPNGSRVSYSKNDGVKTRILKKCGTSLKPSK